MSATVIGGFGRFGEREIHIGDVLSVRFTDMEMRLRLDEEDGGPVLPVPFASVYEIEIGGPGAVTTGGGVIGGGFGVEGALEGMAIAGVLNALTTKTSVNTIVRIDTAHGELFLHTSLIEPNALRIAMSPAIWRIRDRERRQGIR